MQNKPTISASRYLATEVLIAGLSNAFFNAVIAWLMLHEAPERTWSDSTSFAADLVITGFLLPMIVALIVIPIQRNKAAHGNVGTLGLGDKSILTLFTQRFPDSLFSSSLVFGSIGAFVIAPTTLLGFWLTGIASVPTTSYIIFKTVWTGLLAALLVVPIVVYALTHASSKSSTAARAG